MNELLEIAGTIREWADLIGLAMLLIFGVVAFGWWISGWLTR